MLEATTRVSREIAAALARGATVVTGTPRAAQALRRDAVPHSSAVGSRPPTILPWTAWTSSLWHTALLTGATDRLLLNRTQEEFLWRALIERDPNVSTLRDPQSLARLASEAFRAVAEHGGLSRLPGSATNEDTEAFLRLAAAFDARCRRDGYLPRARLEAAMRKAIHARSLVVEDTALFLVGFDRLLPAQHALLDAVRNAGIAVEFMPAQSPAQPFPLAAADHEAAELRSVIEECQAFLQNHPGTRTALVVPGLGSDPAEVTQLERVLRHRLAPKAESILARPGCLPYEISRGTPLSGHTLIADAFDLLEWSSAPLALDRASSVLLSPNLGSAAEQGARAEFDAFELRRFHLLRPEISLDRLLGRLTHSPRRDRLNGMIATLRGLQSAVRRHLTPHPQRPWGEWAEAIRELLRASGWADEPPADTAEFEIRCAWDSALDELATLDFAGTRPTFQQALSTLRGITDDTAIPSPFRDASVQVLSPSQTAGMHFDAVWFLHAGDLSWPAPVAGNPLIGWPLRRELGMPGSDPDADRAHARRITERIAASATSVGFSYAREAADGLQRPSSVLSGLTLPETAPSPTLQRPAPLIDLEVAVDQSRIPPPPPGPVPGGAAVLRAQAACGFRAFAERRLFASHLEPRDPGMNASERGIAVHRVLEYFWETVQRQETLRRMSPEERDRTLGESIESALDEGMGEATSRWDAAYLDIERKRLLRLGRRWLDLEAARTVPFSVAKHESEARDVAIGPLHLTLRVDRVDHTKHGAVLIDYKTGAAAHSGWLGDRPDEPQLPLYAVLAHEPRLHAIAFGKVQPGKKMELTGYEEEPGTLLKPSSLVAESLAHQVEAWKTVLTQLAEDFWNGDTRVAPKHLPTTCKFCAQRLLCRLDAASLDAESEEEATETGDSDDEGPSEADLLG